MSPKALTRSRPSMSEDWLSIYGVVRTRLAKLDERIGGHAGLEFVIRIVDVDLDSIHERHAFLVGLDALGRELRARRDERDSARIFLPGIGVGGYGSVLPPTDLAEISFADVGAQPYVIEVGEGHHRGPRLHHFSELGLSHHDDAREGRAQHRIA